MLKAAAKCPGVPYEDKVAAAWAGFWHALPNYNPRRHNNGLYAYVIRYVRGAVADCITDYLYLGIRNESRSARKDRTAHRPVKIRYNVIEERRDQGGKDADGDNLGRGIVGWINEDTHENR